MNTQQAIDAYLKHQAYMAEYNKRPYVKAKRTQYNQARWKAIKEAKELLKDEQLDK